MNTKPDVRPLYAVPEEYLIETGTYEIYDCSECRGQGVMENPWTGEEYECERCGGHGEVAIES